MPPDRRPRRKDHTVVVLVGNVHRGVLEALDYARSLAPNRLFAVSVVAEPEEQERLEQQWETYGIEVPLEFVYSPYRDLTKPILRYLDTVDARWENDVVTVIIPEFVVTRWWEHVFHNQSALMLKGRLLFRKGTVVTSVPYHIDCKAAKRGGGDALRTMRGAKDLQSAVPTAPGRRSFDCMRDLVFVTMTFAFFGVCIAYVRACEPLIGSAADETRPVRGGGAVTFDNVIGPARWPWPLVAYLVVALLFPERF